MLIRLTDGFPILENTAGEHAVVLRTNRAFVGGKWRSNVLCRYYDMVYTTTYVHVEVRVGCIYPTALATVESDVYCVCAARPGVDTQHEYFSFVRQQSSRHSKAESVVGRASRSSTWLSSGNNSLSSDAESEKKTRYINRKTKRG